MDDSFVFLEHGFSKDRMRKIMFDQIESIVVWKTVPWKKIIVMALLLGPVGTLFIYLGFLALAGRFYYTMFTVGGAFLLLLAITETRYLYYKKTEIQIAYSEKVKKITTIVSPKKLNKLIANAKEKIEKVQRQEVTDVETRQKETPLNPGIEFHS